MLFGTKNVHRTVREVNNRETQGISSVHKKQESHFCICHAHFGQ